MRPIFYPGDFTPEKSAEVLEQSMRHLDATGGTARVTELSLAFLPLMNLIPLETTALFSGIIFPIREASVDLQVSYTLAAMGMYKPARAALRSAVELGLLSIYWNLSDEGPDAIREWVRSKSNTPFSAAVWRRIQEHPNFVAFQRTYNIDGEFMALGDLHNYVHTRGAKYSNALPFPSGSKGLRVASQRFSPEELDGWLTELEKVVRFLALAHLVRYPLGTVRYDWSTKFGIDVPSFGALPAAEVELLEQLLANDVFQKVEELVALDSHATGALAWATALPDLSEEQLEEQQFRFAKDWVRMSGLEAWLANEESTLKFAEGQGWDTSRARARIERVVKWAGSSEFGEESGGGHT